MNEKFYISFPDGICRVMRAHNLPAAVVEASQAVNVTARHKATILNADYKLLAEVHSDGRVVTPARVVEN